MKEGFDVCLFEWTNYVTSPLNDNVTNESRSVGHSDQCLYCSLHTTLFHVYKVTLIMTLSFLKLTCSNSF